MDGRNRYAKISELLKPIIGKTLHKNKIWNRIMIDIGSSRNLIREAFQMMIDLGMIYEVKQDYYKITSCKGNI